jgi:hypothetical protein
MDPSKLKGVLGLLRPKPAQELNVGRRAILGLPRQADEMLPSVVTPPVAEPPPVVGALQKVIEDKMAKPTSRREFLEESAKATASSALRRAAPGALRQVVKKVVETPAIGPETDEAIARAISEVIDKELRVPKKLLNDFGIDVGDFDDFQFRDLVRELQDSAMFHDYAMPEGESVTNGEMLAKALGLTPGQIARRAKLPRAVVEQYYTHPTSVMDSLVDVMRPNYGETEWNNAFEIFEDTPLSRTWEKHAPKAIKEGLEKLGPEFEMSDMTDHLHEALRHEFAREHGRNATGANEHLTRSLESALGKEYEYEASDLLRDVLEDDGFTDSILKEELDKIRGGQ